MLESLSIIMDGGPRVIHSDSIGSFEALEAGVTERVSAYFDASQDEEVYLRENWGETVRASKEHPEVEVRGTLSPFIPCPHSPSPPELLANAPRRYVRLVVPETAPTCLSRRGRRGQSVQCVCGVG
jgi:hypothetical protein